MTKLPCPKIEDLKAFDEICLRFLKKRPHYVRLSKNKKTPVDKGWPDKPWTLSEMEKDIEKYDVGLMPSSIGMAVFDNDSGGEPFFKEIADRFGGAFIGRTPSSSNVPGRGHAWVACNEPENIRSKRLYFDGVHVGEIRCYRTQIRLTKKAISLLCENEALASLFISESYAIAADIHDLTDKKNLEAPSPKTATSKATNLGDDSGRQLPGELSEELTEEFRVTKDRSHCIDRWCWRLRIRGYSPAEIFRILKPIKRVQERVKEKNRNLKADILDSCLAYDDMKREQALGDFPEESLLVLKDWVFIVDRDQFFNLKNSRQLSEKQFKNQFRHLFPKKDPITCVMMKQTPVRKFDSAFFEPNGPSCREDEVNLWRSSGVVATPGNTLPFEQHVEYLFPDPKSRELLLDILAQIVCRPNEKMMFATLLVGKQGIGKSFFALLLERILGAHNVSEATSDDLNKDWTGYQENKCLVIVHEMMMSDRRDVANRMKSVITDPKLRINKKHAPVYNVDNKMNLLSFSNYENAVYLEAGDRRWVVLSSEAEPRDAAYYDKLFAWAHSPAAPGALLDMLETRPVRINPKGQAPMTAAKAKMAEATKPEWKHQIDRWVTDETGPFGIEMFLFDDVRDVLRKKGLSPSSGNLTDYLKKVGAIELGRSKHAKKRSYTFWAIRNQEALMGLSHLDRIERFERQSLVDF